MDNTNDNDNENDNNHNNNNSSPVFQGMVRMASRRVRNIHHHHHFRVGSESTRTISENEINSATERDYNVDPPIVGSNDGPILLIHHDHYHIYVDREMNQNNDDEEEKEEEEVEEDIQINEEEEELEEIDEDFQDEVDEDFEAAGVEDNEMHDQDDDGEPIDEDIEIQHGQNEEELVYEEDFYFEEEEDGQEEEVAIELDQEAEVEEDEEQQEYNEDIEIDIGEEEIEVEEQPEEDDDEDEPIEEDEEEQDDNIEIDDEYDGFDETYYRYHAAEGDNTSSNDDEEDEESNARIILRRSIFSRRGELPNHFPIVNYNIELSEILRQRDNQLSPNPQPFTSSSSGNRYSRNSSGGGQNSQFEYQHLFDHPVTESYGCIGWFIYHKFQKSRLFRVESSSKFLSQLLSFYQALLEKQTTAQTFENQEKINFFISCFISMTEIKTLLETSRLSTKELIPIKFTLDIIEHHYRLNDFPLFDHYRNHVLPVSELFYSKITNDKLTIINKRLVQALSSISNYQDIVSIHDKKSQYFDYFKKQLWSIRNQSDLNDLSFYYQ